MGPRHSVARAEVVRLSRAYVVPALAAAVVADAAQDDVVGDGVARLPLHLVERPLELRIGERLDLAAVFANEMVVVLAARLHRLVAGGGCADVDALDEAVARQLLQRPVDARDPDGAAAGPEGV